MHNNVIGCHHIILKGKGEPGDEASICLDPTSSKTHFMVHADTLQECGPQQVKTKEAMITEYDRVKRSHVSPQHELATAGDQ